MFKINKRLVPIKAHYFFFMAAMGPILPQINVYGKDLGIDPAVMGYITSVLPILYILSKPVVGFLIDSFPSTRKLIFMGIVALSVLCYVGFYTVPSVPAYKIPHQPSYIFSKVNGICDKKLTTKNANLCLINHKMVNCTIQCGTNSSIVGFIGLSLPDNNLTLCVDSANDAQALLQSQTCDQPIQCEMPSNATETLGDCFYKTATFWSFVVLMSIGTIGFNVANCVSDATCFDVLGEKTMNYGAQRVYGTIGFGVTALISGVAVYFYQDENTRGVAAITPAIIIMIVFGAFDLVSIKWLKLPKFTCDGEPIVTKVTELLMQKSIMIFLVFATLAGILDSFIIYYMFWYLEEVAEQTGYMDSIKLIEGCVVAAECLGGEILFFLISGKILNKIGYVHCLSLCFCMYFIRFSLISMIPNPWWLVLIELFMQGSSYALCYTCIVAYASAISPPGTTATIQGLVAGMDDGLGFAIGSLIGGQMYKYYGGKATFRIFAIGALVTCIAHIFLRPAGSGDSHISIDKQQHFEVVAKDDLCELQSLQKPNEIKAVIVTKS